MATAAPDRAAIGVSQIGQDREVGAQAAPQAEHIIVQISSLLTPSCIVSVSWLPG